MLVDLANSTGTYLHEVFVNQIDWWVILGLLAQILFTFELAETLAGSGVTATCLHPATYMPTKIVPHPFSTLEEGGEATFALVAGEALEGVSGRYFNGTRESRADPQAYDPGARRRLDEISRRLVA